MRPSKVVGAILVGAGTYCLVGIAQRTCVGDLMICDGCGRRMSGYGFVAYVQGADPRVCPECKRAGLRPASLWDMIAFWR